MKLSEILLKGKGKAKVDEDLDAIFQTSAGPSTISSTTTPSQEQDSGRSLRKRKASDTEENDQKRSERDHGRKKPKEVHANAIASKVAVHTRQTTPSTSHEAGDELDDEESEDEALPVHESLLEGSKSRSKPTSTRKTKYVPDGETKEQRDRRSIFIGNVPSEVAKNRPALKKLRKHILAYVPQAAIESIRLRSVALSVPTASLEDDEGKKKHRQQSRAAKWREERKTGGDAEKSEEKVYLTPKEKRKLAFIKGEVHEQSASIHAYVVFAYPIPEELRTKNVPYKQVMDPFEATREAVEKCDGTTFLDHTLRVDYVIQPSSSTSVDVAGARTQTDPRLSVFVGNLDFASSEEDLRAFFEALLCVERGTPVGSDDTSNRHRSVWVTRVRIVRDRDTQLGKGFAYVQFSERDCVDEVLALEQDKLKFAKRKLRIQRCKLLPSAPDKPQRSANVSASRVSSNSREKQPSAPTHNASIVANAPHGDPRLGEKLAGLSKDMRKQIKATDSDRVARRLAKKKARMVLEKEGVKAKGKERARERKSSSASGKSLNKGRKPGKARVRSDRAEAKKNTKKQ